MTDLSKLSVSELRNDFAALSITHPHFKWALEAFDELARRLGEAEKRDQFNYAERLRLEQANLPATGMKG